MTSSLENSHSFEEERMEKGNSETFLIIKLQILGKARSLCGIFFPIPRPVFQLINALNVQQFTTVYHISAQFNTCDDDDVRDSWKFGVITSTSMQEYASVAFFPVFSMMHPTQLFICTGHTQKTKTKISQSFKKCLEIFKLIFILIFTHDFWRKN